MFKPGRSGNPKGKAPGTRNKISNVFLENLHDFWCARKEKNEKTNGQRLLEIASEKDPMGFVKAVVALLPKQIKQENTLHVSFVDALRQIQAVDITPSERMRELAPKIVEQITPPEPIVYIKEGWDDEEDEDD